MNLGLSRASHGKVVGSYWKLVSCDLDTRCLRSSDINDPQVVEALT